jgi:hypothetical protein
MTTPEQQQRIAELAYRIWEQQGRPAGRDREHWEQARRELEGDSGNAVLSRPEPVGTSAQSTPGVVKDGYNRHKPRRR